MWELFKDKNEVNEKNVIGFIYGVKKSKSLGYFIEGKYNRYWNREWYDFKFGINYTIF